MDKKLKLTLHVIISTVAFSCLTAWMLMSYEVGNTEKISLLVTAQALVFLVSFLLLEHEFIMRMARVLARSRLDNNSVNHKGNLVVPGINDILLMFLAVAGAVLMGYMLMANKVDVFYYVGWAGLALFWALHLFYAFRFYRTTE